MRKLIYWMLFLVIGLGIPYLVQFKLKFFGATFVTMKDIIGLWILSALITGAVLLSFYNDKK